jgi:hypothetical protein
MKEYVFPTPPIVDNFPEVSLDEATARAQSFLDFIGFEARELNCELYFRFMAVFRFRAACKTTNRITSGWVIGGSAPHLRLSDEEISTPIEALAIYSFFLRHWADMKGVPQADGSVPEYRLPPDWELVTYEGFLETQLGSYQSYFSWVLAKANKDSIVHPEIYAMCEKRGWFYEGKAKKD